MRIAQIMAGAPTGGAELFFERLTIALAQSGDAVLPIIRGNPDRAGRLQSAGLEPAQFRFGSPLDLLTRPRIRSVLTRFDPSIAIAWMSRAARFTPSGPWVLAGRLGGYYDLRHYRHCDHLIANTRQIAAYITSHGWPAARVHHLPNFAPDLLGAPPVSRASLQIPEHVPLILALGRLHRNKGFDLLIRALPHIPRAHVLIAGEGPEHASLTALARSRDVLDRLHLPGWRTDTAALLAAADLLVCPSRHEPLGNVIIEAWSAARPVIAAAADGPRELITADSDGILVPLEGPEALADAINALVQDPARADALARSGRASYQARFAEAPVLQQWRRFLATVEKP
ncbi:MAG TPA: glycosyltransferase [Acetobacteraceae bacterium]